VLKIILVGVGGGLGSVARYLVSLWAVAAISPDLPAGTFLVNVVGSWLVALVMELSLQAFLVPAEVRLFLVTGVAGGFTTYSTFNHELLRMLEQRAWATAAGYLVATVVGCLVAGLVGLGTARLVASGTGVLGSWRS
jgi:CrcB protein